MPTSPSRQPNMRMCTEDRAASTSARMRGKKFFPSAQGSSVAAVHQAKSSAASRGPAVARAANAAVAACAPSEVTASGGGGQLGRRSIPSTRRCTTTRTAVASAASVRLLPRIGERR